MRSGAPSGGRTHTGRILSPSSRGTRFRNLEIGVCISVYVLNEISVKTQSEIATYSMEVSVSRSVFLIELWKNAGGAFFLQIL